MSSGSEQALLARLEAGYALQHAGQLSEAEAAYRSVLKSDPDNIHALNLLGALLVNQGKPTEAARLLAKAVAQSPDDESYANLGLALKDSGDLVGAVTAFETALQLAPQSPKHFNNLGNTKLDFGETDQAIELYRRAVSMAPNYPDAWNNLARAYNQAGQIARAEDAIRRALVLSPSASMYITLGDVLVKRCAYAESLAAYDRALESDPADVDGWISKSIAHKEIGQRAEAAACLNRASELDPECARVAFCKGMMAEQYGDMQEAESAYRDALSLQPGFVAALYQLTQLKSYRPSQSDRQTLSDILDDTNSPREQRRHAAFGLARIEEQTGNFEQALDYFETGHQLILTGRSYDDGQTERLYRAIESVGPYQVRSEGIPHADRIPVFVLGMPRSGTSLAEQVLASHDEIIGTGESSFLEDCATQATKLTGRPYPEFIPYLTEGQIADLGATYRKRLFSGDVSARFYIDKTPMNFQYIGFAALILPEARFIHCRRNPVDNCLSIFRLPFDAHQTYAHSLSSLRDFYAHYQRLMAHWRSSLGNRILDVQYESVVAELEPEARAMLAHIGASYDPAVLLFHETERVVRTPSAGQVRQPIYGDSVAYWARYGSRMDILQPLLTSDV